MKPKDNWKTEMKIYMMLSIVSKAEATKEKKISDLTT